jgi:cardiolipin synthase
MHGRDDHDDERPADGVRSVDEWGERLYALLGLGFTDGNEVRILRNGDEIFPAMLDAIEAATSTVDLVTFVYWQGDIAVRFATALADAARRGCRVRVLLDAVGARKIDEPLIEEMSEAGCDVRWFRPITDNGIPQIGEVNHRTHRKILVCDASVGFTGGVGIADEWTGDARDPGEWRDTHVAVRGPAVAGLAASFLDNWADEGDDDFLPLDEPLGPSDRPGAVRCGVLRGSAEIGASDARRLILALVWLARSRVRIATAYFGPDEPMMAAVLAAVERGVDVQILLPGEHADKRFVQLAGEEKYQRLIDAGVRMCTFEPSMMHAKVITVDGGVASVGSANFNQRSMEHDEETNLVLLDPDVVGVLDRHLDDDFSRSVVLDPSRWAERGVLQRAAEKIASTVDDLL